MDTIQQDVTTFQLKADFLPMTVLRLTSGEIPAIERSLKATVEKTPNYFKHAPIIIDLGGITETLKPYLDIKSLCTMLKDLNIIPVGIRGLSQKNHDIARDNGLAILNAVSQPKKEEEPPKTTNEPKYKAPDETSTTSAEPVIAPTPSTTPSGRTKIITKPVRSGTQVYAKDGDLIILSSVNAGAEVIADGNIHIHGALRGRALSGARGYENARIFCQELDAELVAVAGHYLVDEKMPSPKEVKSMVQIFLKNDKITIETT